MPETQCGKSTGTVKARRSCCEDPIQAATKGHQDCYVLLHQPEPGGNYPLLYECLHAALRHGHMDFTKYVIDDQKADVMTLAQHCVRHNDLASMRKAISLDPAVLKLPTLPNTAATVYSVSCLQYLLENGVHWEPKSLFWALAYNRMDVLEVVLRHSREWHPQLPGYAAIMGNVGFLKRIFAAGCPSWKSARDGEPDFTGHFTPPGTNQCVGLKDWTLVVPSCLLRSGPVLLLAAQKGTPLTPRMQGMLGEVRARALALAGCFHRAKCLSQGPEPAAGKWASMGRVPVEIIQNIATAAGISIIAHDLVK